MKANNIFLRIISFFVLIISIAIVGYYVFTATTNSGKQIIDIGKNSFKRPIPSFWFNDDGDLVVKIGKATKTLSKNELKEYERDPDRYMEKLYNEYNKVNHLNGEK